MAITFDAAGGVDSASSWTHVCTSATDLWVGVRSTTAPSGVTYNSVAMTQINSTLVSTDNYTLWHLTNPTAGSHSVAVTGGGATVFGDSASYAGSTGRAFENGNDAVPAGASPVSMALTPSELNSWMVGFVFDRSGTAPSANTNCVLRANQSTASSMGLFDSNAVLAQSALFTMKANYGATSGGAIFATFGGNFVFTNALTGGLSFTGALTKNGTFTKTLTAGLSFVGQVAVQNFHQRLSWFLHRFDVKPRRDDKA